MNRNPFLSSIKIQLSFFTFLFCSLLCAQNSFEIRGKIKKIDDKSLIIIQYQNKTLDSCYVKNGVFSLRGHLPIEPSDVLLRVKEGNIALDTPLFIGNEKISIEASKRDFPYDIQTSGSLYDNDRFNYIQSIKNQPKDQINTVLLAFIRENIRTPFALKLLNMVKTNLKKAEIESLLQQVNPNLMYHPFATSIKNYLYTLDLEKGDSYINFNAFDTSKSEFEFTNSFNGKPVLLVFSSLYCHWCENTLPKLEILQNKMSNQLNIVLFYMDEEADDVEKFTQKGEYPWVSVWDPMRKFSNYMNYSIQATPTFYLFDTQGKLIDKIEGFTERIDELIEEKLNE